MQCQIGRNLEKCINSILIHFEKTENIALCSEGVEVSDLWLHGSTDVKNTKDSFLEYHFAK